MDTLKKTRKYSCYEYELYQLPGKPERWCYNIFDPYDDSILRESSEWFESEGEANLAAIGHIDLLENGEG